MPVARTCFQITLLCGALAGWLVATQARAVPPAREPALPTTAQLAWHDLELGMFVHLRPPGPNDTYAPDTFENLAECAKLMGARYILVVAKHNNGYLFWNSKTRARAGIQHHKKWKDGKGDVLKEIADAARKRGLGLGVYNVPADWPDGIGDGGATRDAKKREAFIKDYLEQARELCTNYGPLVEYWMDGGVPKDFLERINEVIRPLQPKMVCFQGTVNPIRWVGNEEGYAPEVFWNRAKHGHPNGGNLGAGDPRGPAWVPFECDTFLGGGWMGPGILRKPEQIVDMYYKSVGRGAGAVWNLSPPVSQKDMEVCAAVSKMLDDALGHPLAKTQGRGEAVELDLKRSLEIDHVVVQEDLRFGERVLRYAVEVRTDVGWVKVGRGQSLGHKRIFKFAPLAATRVRVAVAESLDEPVIRSLYVTRTGVRTPDATPPSAPADLMVKAEGDHVVCLTWKAADDSESGIRRYRVWRNGVLVGSTTATEYRDLDLPEQTTFEYAVDAVNGSGLAGGKVSAKVSTPRDTTPPKVERLTQTVPHHLLVTFDEPIEETSATRAENYKLDGGGKVTAAAMHGNPRTVKLAVTGLKELQEYTLIVTAVTDRAKQPHPVAGGTAVKFRFTDQLDAWLPLTEGAGKQVADRVSGRKIDVGGAAAWQDGDRKALVFDGKGTYVDLGPMTTSVNDPFTIAVWVRPVREKPLGPGGREVVWSRDRGLNKYLDYKLHLGLTNAPAPYFVMSPPTHTLGVHDLRLNPKVAGPLRERWTHLAVTRDADSQFRFYVDGKLAGKADGQGVLQPHNPVTNLILGAHQRHDLKAYVPSYSGAMRDFRVYGRDLDEREIQTLFEAGK